MPSEAEVLIKAVPCQLGGKHIGGLDAFFAIFGADFVKGGVKGGFFFGNALKNGKLSAVAVCQIGATDADCPYFFIKLPKLLNNLHGIFHDIFC